MQKTRNMKKPYLAPVVEIEKTESENILASSGVYSDDNENDIGYGGIDENGEMIPGSRFFLME